MAAACPMARRLYEKGQHHLPPRGARRGRWAWCSRGRSTSKAWICGATALILSRVGPGQVFGETYALTGGLLLVDAVAAEDCEILAIRRGRLCWRKTTRAPRGRGSCWRNLVSIFAGKNRALSHAHLLHQPPRPSGAGLSRTFPPRPWSRAAAPFPSPLTGSSWRITWVWTAAPSPKSWAACGTRDCWRPAKTTSSSTGWGRWTVDKLPAFLYNHTRCVPPRPSSPAGSRLPRQAGISQAQGTHLVSLYYKFDARKASASRGERMPSFIAFGRNLP